MGIFLSMMYAQTNTACSYLLIHQAVIKYHMD